MLDGHTRDWIASLLALHRPFSGLPPASRERLLDEASVRELSDGETVLTPDAGPVSWLRFVASGSVIGDRAGEDVLVIEPGEAFPVAAVRGERPTRKRYRADGETTVIEVPAAVVDEVLRDRGGLAALQGDSLQPTERYADAAGDDRSSPALETPLGTLVTRGVVSCAPGSSIRDAVDKMHGRRVGSIIIADEHGRPAGIFTLHDLRSLVANGVDLGQPISEVMTTRLHTLDSREPGVEAVLIMARYGIRHVVVTDQGRLAGVISERDLFALKRADVVDLIRAIDGAADLDALAATRDAVRRFIDALMGYGASAHHVTRVLTLLNDHTVTRAIALCQEAAPEPTVPFTWVAFGSEGRCEQTLVTDQDNGIVFDAPDSDADAVRAELLPLARRINSALARCGFKLCPGNIMAGNPELCLSRGEWEARFARLIRSNTPENLLRSSIYFDLRPVDGPAWPVADLRGRILEQARDNSLFRRMMAGNALQQSPPLGLLRDFVTEKDDAGERTLDLKTSGLTPFVDGARLLSLEGAIDETSTACRLTAAGEAGLVQPEVVEAWSGAFAHLQWRRLERHQECARAGESPTNRLNPDRLNALDRRVLKEAFRQARDLQKRLAVRYQL